MYMSPDEFPLPYEYRHFTFDDMVGAPPEDIDERVVVFLDCGNIDRMPVDFLQRDGLHILNIDHHHDNTRFGTVNLVSPQASCTAEIVFGLAAELGAEITPKIAEALYVGLVTDTGKFMYENTTPAAHRMAADADRGGGRSPRRLPPAVRGPALPPPPAALAGAAADRPLRRRRRSRSTTLTRADFEETGALETDSEGIIDHLRSVEGTKVAVLVRELLADDRRGQSKVSLRATDGSVDVSIIARAARRRRAPPGRRRVHRAPARGAGGADPRPGRRAARARPCRPGSSCSTSPPGSPRTTSSRGCAGRSRRGSKVGHAGTLDPFATGLLLILVGRATRAQRFLLGLPKTYRAVARLGWVSDTGDRDGELDPDRQGARRAAGDPDRHVHAAPARLLRREGGRRGPVQEGAQGRGRGGRGAPGHRLPVGADREGGGEGRRSRSSARPGPTCASS